MQKKFFLVVAALVSVSFVLIGCPTDTETVTQTVPW
jgi:predicted small secreted protein